MRVLLLILSLLISTAVNADIKGQALSKASEKISSTIGNLIPGEGVTEVSVEIREEDNPDFEILGVRDILSKENSNLFTQFSIHNNEVNGDNRYIGNLGLGYRFLNSDKSMMFGANSFYDKDIQEDHSRISLGFEVKASILDFTLNKYQKTTNMKVVNGDEAAGVYYMGEALGSDMGAGDALNFIAADGSVSADDDNSLADPGNVDIMHRTVLTAPVNITLGRLPTVKIAFGTTAAIGWGYGAAGTAGHCTTSSNATGLFGAEPSVVITFQ